MNRTRKDVIDAHYRVIEQSDLCLEELRALSVKITMLIVEEKIRLDNIETKWQHMEEQRSDNTEEKLTDEQYEALSA